MSEFGAVVDETAALEGLGLEDLRAIWRARYGAPPKLRSPELVGLMLAWRIQAEREGGLDAELRRMLRRPSGVGGPPDPASGTRLTREWQGVRHEVVTLTGGGYVYKGDRYKSLSQIARTITGTRWNGPRFFGLRTEEAAS